MWPKYAVSALDWKLMTELTRRVFLGGAAAFGLTGCLSYHQGPMPGEPKGATFEMVGGTRVHFTDEGEGPPVVLIHGFASSMGAWADLKKTLAPKHRVIALDLKGFGWTDRPEGDYSPKAQAALVWGLLGKRGVKEPVMVVAHSWGSSVALEMALAKPERVKKLALYDAWIYEEQLPSTFYFARADGMGEAIIGAFYDERPDDKIAIAFYDKRFVTEELIETVEDQLSRPGTKAAALAAIRGQRYADRQALYKKIQAPTLLLWGREDRVTLLEYGERLSKDLPNAKLVVYPQCGHFPMIEARTASSRDLAQFLDAPDAARDNANKAAEAERKPASEDGDGATAAPQPDASEPSKESAKDAPNDASKKPAQPKDGSAP